MFARSIEIEELAPHWASTISSETISVNFDEETSSTVAPESDFGDRSLSFFGANGIAALELSLDAGMHCSPLSLLRSMRSLRMLSLSHELGFGDDATWRLGRDRRAVEGSRS